MVAIKYIGSKNKLSKHLIPIIHDYMYRYDISTYIEPFVGGANLIDKVSCRYRHGNDIEPLVIELFKECLRNKDFLSTLPTLPTRGLYFDVIHRPHNYSVAYRAAILFFASYNGRINGGYGAVTVDKYGTVRNYFQEAKRNLQKQLPNLHDVVFTNLDYKLLPLEKNSLIYCDPPYQDCYYKDRVYDKNGFNCTEFWVTKQLQKI